MDEDKNHRQPTPEELEAQIAAATAEADNPTPVVEEETPEPEVIPEPEETPVVEEEPQEEKKEVQKEEADYKQKFIESSREAQVVAHSKKEFEIEIEQAQNLPEPTEDQVKQEFKDYDLLSEFEQQMAKEMTHRRLKERAITEITGRQKEAEAKIGERAKEADVFAIDPDMLKKFPKLEGRQDEFKVFATKNTRLTLDLEDVAALFSTTLPEPTKHKGQMFETGSGGANDKQKPKNDKISLDEARILMNTDYKKYRELLSAGKIEMDV